jgi:ketosteroid isomerase-like protein
MNEGAPTTSGSTSRSLIYVALGVVALAVVTIVVVLLAGGREAAEFPADSPEAALQRYLAAYEEGDLDAAHALFSADVRERMDREAYQRAVDSWGVGTEPNRTVLFDSTTGTGDRVELHLIVEEFHGDGLSGDTYRSPRDVRLLREDGAWRIDQALIWLDPAPIEPFQ